MAQQKLTSLTEIYTFFRTNRTPVYFVTPAPYNLLGIDQWVGNFEYLTYFDSFDGYHPRCFTPPETGAREFKSMEDVGNYLLGHKDTADLVRARGGKGKVLMIMFDETSEELVKELGLEMALPPAKLRTHIDSKIVTTQLGNDAGVPSVPNALGRAKNFAELRALADKHKLGHKDTADLVKARGGRGKVLLIMFDETSEELVKELGLEMALPPAKLRTHLDSKIVTTRLGNDAGVPSVPNALGRAKDFAELRQLAERHGLGDHLVVQTPYGDSGRTTFFIRTPADWDRYAERMAGEELKVMRYVNHMPGTVEGCATRHGTLVGPIMTDITGFAEVTPYKGGWCGNDASPRVLPPDVQDRVRAMVQRLGDRLWREGYKGVFCCDFLIDADTDDVYLGEINPRISGASPPTNLITTTYGGCPLFLFHLLEFMAVDWELDLAQVQSRWADYDTWSQLILKQTEDKVELITEAPTSGIWRMNRDGNVSFVRRAAQITSVGDEQEAFYLRVYGVGQYRYHGADLGILIARGRMQTDDRKLTDRAKLWNAGIKAQFKGVAPAPAAPALPAEAKWMKMF